LPQHIHPLVDALQEHLLRFRRCGKTRGNLLQLFVLRLDDVCTHDIHLSWFMLSGIIRTPIKREYSHLWERNSCLQLRSSRSRVHDVTGAPFSDNAFTYIHPVVQQYGIQIGAIGPFDCSGIWIDAHLSKYLFVPQRTPKRAKQHRLQVDNLLIVIIKFYAKMIVWNYMHSAYMDINSKRCRHWVAIP